MKSICVLSNLYAPVVSGSATQCEGLARELTRRGHDVIVITAKLDPASADREVVEGVHVYRLPALRLPKMSIALNFPWLNLTMTPWNLRRMREIIQRHRVEILHVHNHMFDMALSGVRLARQLKLPLVVTIHTIIKHANPVYNLLLYPLDRFLLKRWVIDKADAVICPDVNVQQYLFERFARSDCDIVAYGISLKRPSQDDIQRIREKYDLAGKRVILSIGHVHAIRNRIDLIRAMPRVQQAIPEAILLIVGSETDSRARREVRALGVENVVVFAGAQPRRIIPAFLAIADIEAHWLNQDDPGQTSLGVASMEAMYAGKAVFSAANENTFGPGVLKHGTNILIARPGRPESLATSIVQVLQDHQYRGRIGREARATVERHFSWTSVTDRTVEVYEGSIAARQIAPISPMAQNGP